MARPLLVGMNNSLSVEPEHALYPLPDGCTGNRLWKMLHNETGATMQQYLAAFERTNLVVGPWDKSAGRESAASMLPGLSGRTVVLLGKAVLASFAGVPKVLSVGDRWDLAARGKPGEFEPAMFYALPHPSGRNPWYNDRENRKRAARLLAELYYAAKTA